MRNFTIFYIVFVFLSVTETSNAQIVIGKPNLQFTRACASPTFNTYNVTFTFNPASALGSTNQFIIELSDETGDFTSATAIYTSAEGSVTLTFNWFRETSQTTSVFIQTSETLSVNQPGTYFVETNYGSCTSNSFSNRVTISEAGAGGASEITSSLGNPYCSTDGPTTLTTTNGVSYQWFN